MPYSSPTLATTPVAQSSEVDGALATVTGNLNTTDDLTRGQRGALFQWIVAVQTALTRACRASRYNDATADSVNAALDAAFAALIAGTGKQVVPGTRTLLTSPAAPVILAKVVPGTRALALTTFAPKLT